MAILDHGLWIRYTPTELPYGVPASVMFLQSDNLDWYEYAKSDVSFKNINQSVKLVMDGNKCVVANRDPTALFPDNLSVYEIDDTVSDAQTYVGKLYNNGAFVDPPALVPPTITDRQFFQQLAIDGIITQDDALASNAAVIPPPLLAIINGMPADQQFNVKMIVSGATIFHRNSPITSAIGTAYGWTTTQIDDFFKAAALL